jgi:signal transduction histidine kinase
MNHRVLVIDDDRDTLRYVAALLKDNGYLLHAADRGELGLRIAEEVPLDLVLLDIRMGHGLDGIETCRRLKAQDASRRVPVIFLTGWQDEDTMVRAFDAGGADYVVKPFDARVLLARVRTHCELGVLSRDLESALAERTKELHAANARLQQLAREISLVEERERRRLAGELHDSPMQKLALAQMHVGAAGRDAAPGSRERLGTGLGLMREVLQELRSLQFDLSPPLLHQEGLAPALGWLAARATERFGVRFSFGESGSTPQIPQDLAIVLFQCARELVYNVAKHASASVGRIELAGGDGEVLVTVVDDGTGFVAGGSPRKQGGEGGFGLFSIRERLALFGGELCIESDGNGTRASMRTPLADGVERAAANEPASERLRQAGDTLVTE